MNTIATADNLRINLEEPISETVLNKLDAKAFFPEYAHELTDEIVIRLSESQLTVTVVIDIPNCPCYGTVWDISRDKLSLTYNNSDDWF